MDWKLSRLDEAFEPPLQTFSMHDTRDAALLVARDKPREGRIRNRIDGPNDVVLSHDQIADWCKEHPAPAKQGKVDSSRPSLRIAFRATLDEVRQRVSNGGR